MFRWSAVNDSNHWFDWIFKSLMIFDFHLISSHLIDIIWSDLIYLKRCELCQSFNHWMINHSIIRSFNHLIIESFNRDRDQDQDQDQNQDRFQSFVSSKWKTDKLFRNPQWLILRRKTSWSSTILKLIRINETNWRNLETN
jgi:hypothetical protein